MDNARRYPDKSYEKKMVGEPSVKAYGRPSSDLIWIDAIRDQSSDPRDST